jgi:Primase C terminal 2 (PriCT-2)/RepB DNA-primase from phage plasmid
MDIDIEQSTQFLKLIDPQATSFTFQTFEDSKPATNGNLARVVLRSPAYPELQELHARGAGVYLTVNETDGKGRKIENIRRIRAVWQEDDNDVSHQPLPMPPSMVVETSPKHFHRYWLVEGDWPADEQGRTDFAAVMERMVEDFGSDKNAKDISRVLRVPGFLHRKNGEPHLVHIVEASGKRYTRAQIIAAFPPLEREQKQHHDDEWKSDGNDVERIRDAVGHINADDRDTWIRVGMAIKNHLGESGRVLWDEWSSRSSKFHERDQDKTWSSFDRNYSGAPIGIGTLFFLAKRAGWKPKKKAHVGPDDEEKLLNELATLSPIAYARRRKEAAKQLSIPVAVLDKEIDRRRPEEDEQRNFLPHWNVETWSEEVDGDALLDELRRCLKRYIVLPPHADVAVALWVLHTWVFEAFDITPYLVITSPTRRCGKTVLMTLLYWLCRNGKKSDSMSKAAIYRSVDQEKPTLVLDEVGWVLDDRDERQGILCGGFERNGMSKSVKVKAQI